jgi:hypothetical protein
MDIKIWLTCVTMTVQAPAAAATIKFAFVPVVLFLLFSKYNRLKKLYP